MRSSFLWWYFGCTAPVTPFSLFPLPLYPLLFPDRHVPCSALCRPHFCVQAFFQAPCSAFGGKKLFVPPYSGALPLFGILAVYLSSDGHSVVFAKHLCLALFDYTKHICFSQVVSEEIFKLFCLISSCISEIHLVYYT